MWPTEVDADVTSVINMDTTSQDTLVPRIMEIKAVQAIIFYLLTLNCVSFMLCKPPFSLSTLMSSTLQKRNTLLRPYKDITVCFHPQLFIAPYMYLFSQPYGGCISPCTKIDRVSTPPRSCLSDYSCDSIESGANGPTKHAILDFLSEKEMGVIERTKTDIKGILKTNRKQKARHLNKRDDAGPDVSVDTKEEGMHTEPSVQKSKHWSIKKRYQAEKLSIQKAREEIARKKYQSKKFCRNQIRLLGKNFLEKSLQQGLEIQQQLANADRILRAAAQNMG